MTAVPGDGRVALARRLKALRLEHWPGRRVRQTELATALEVSSPSVSSWENLEDPKVPTTDRLAEYARFFATERSLAQPPPKLLPLRQLTADERRTYDELLKELLELRERAMGGTSAESGMSQGLLWFPDGGDITIVCTALPQEYTEGMPYADPYSPDFSLLYTYSDPDALIELFGHLRAANPLSQVYFRIADQMSPDHLKNHLVVLGGVDWNTITRDTLTRFDLPVQQIRRATENAVGGFTVVEDGRQREFLADLRSHNGHTVLVSDVAHVFRATSPYSNDRTITVFNGAYSRGTLGAVRALTDARERDKNERFVNDHFAGQDAFSILSAVIIVEGNVVVTPDWTDESVRLHTWPV